MIKQNKAYKVALVGDCLANGGAEKVHALLSGYFHNSGLEVHNCIFVDWITYDYSGSLLNLGKVAPNAFFVYRKMKRFLALKKFMKDNRFDAVIDFRMRPTFGQEWLLAQWVYPKHVIYSVRSGILPFYFPESDELAQLIYKKKAIVAVSEAIKDRIAQKQLSDAVYTIYNPIDFELIDALKEQYQVAEDSYIVASGRMNEEVKQFDKLIEAYSESVLPDRNIKLVLLGEGQHLEQYKALTARLGLQDKVVFKGFVKNPYPYYQHSLFMVLSSRNEGFPNVIIEALATGVPVVSFDCFSGPNEIITQEQNGLLVENQNFKKLTATMNRMVENQSLYSYCKQNARASVARFSMEIIGKQWLELFKNTVS